jgi:hypothetical protein
MTQRYAHLRDEAMRQAADLAGDIINDAITQNRTATISLSKKAKNG